VLQKYNKKLKLPNNLAKKDTFLSKYNNLGTKKNQTTPQNEPREGSEAGGIVNRHQ